MLMKKKFILFLLAAAFMDCAHKNEQNGNIASIDSTNVPVDHILISRQQFENGVMTLGKLERRPFANPVHANGYIDVPPENRAHVSALFGGYVQNIHLLEGNKVKKGQFLVTIMNPDFIEMQQEYLSLKEQIGFLKAEFDRQKILSEENISSQKNFLKAKSDYQSSLARVNALREKLELLHIDLKEVERGKFSPNAKVIAPISGSISKSYVNNGMYVQPTDELLEIVNLDHKHLELQVFEKEVLQIREGQPIRYRVPDYSDETFEGEVHLVSKSIDEEKRLAKIHGHIENEELPFISGMYIEASILTDTTATWSLPLEAVFEDVDKSYVLVTSDEESSDLIFELREVLTGRKSTEFIEIKNVEIFNSRESILVKGGFQLVKFD